LSELEYLDLSLTGVSDEGLKHVRGLWGLRHLDLRETRITDEGLMCLSQLRSLKFLGLYHTIVSRKGVEELAEAMPECRILWEGSADRYRWEVTPSGQIRFRDKP
jgi:hypothetical protein